MWLSTSAVFVLFSQISLAITEDTKSEKKPHIIIILADDVVIWIFLFYFKGTSTKYINIYVPMLIFFKFQCRYYNINNKKVTFNYKGWVSRPRSNNINKLTFIFSTSDTNLTKNCYKLVIFGNLFISYGNITEQKFHWVLK